MTVRSIREIGDPALRRTAAPVNIFDAELGRLVSDLTETLAASGGAGLAAPQIGVSLRVFAIDPGLPGNDGRLDHLINPVLDLPDDEEQSVPEGCLSVPGIHLDTRRRRTVTVKGLTRHGDPVQLVGSGPLARCLQHQTDHLDGVLFADRQDAMGITRILATIREANWARDQVKVRPR